MRFFRNRPLPYAVTKVILPKLVTTKSRLAYKKTRKWRAAFSTGEEHYSRALLLSDQLVRKLRGWAFEIVAM